jgi:hypothetical protein
MEVVALNAQIQAVANVPTAAQVSIVGPNRLFIVTKDGSVRVSYFGKVHIVRQHSEETVVLDPGEGPHALAGDGAHQPPKPPGKPPKIRYFVWIPIPFAIWEALESPDRP